MTTFRCDEAVDAVRADPDPASRGRRATEMINHFQCMTRSLAMIRGDAILTLYAQGVLPKDIADDIGLSKGRVSQIIHWYAHQDDEDLNRCKRGATTSGVQARVDDDPDG